MKAKRLKSSQILRAHMPYFRRPGHNYKMCEQQILMISLLCTDPLKLIFSYLLLL